MKKLLFTIIFLITFSAAAHAQEVTIDQDTANKCSKAFDEVVALRDEVKVKTQAVEDLKQEILRLQIELTKASTKAMMLEEQAVADRAIINAMIPKLRAKRIALINIF